MNYDNQWNLLNGRLSGISKYCMYLLLAAVLFGTYACAPSSMVEKNSSTSNSDIKSLNEVDAPTPDPRVGLKAGLFDAEQASWNLNMISQTRPPKDFLGVTNSDLAFKENFVIQGNYNGFMVWDISNPGTPELVVDFLCPASQSDVSVHGNLLFVSGEGLGGRLDCGTQGVDKKVSDKRLRGIRIFDISDIQNPKYVSNVQTCRGSHTHSVLADPQDQENVYIYVSGSAPVRPEEEMPGCSRAMPDEDPNSALFRIEVIKVPLDNPEEAKIVNSPRIFENLTKAPRHGREINTEERGPDQCHDITLYPEIGLAGGACEGYGLLLDISDPANPKRIDAVADSNFAYWHSATFNNDGSKVLFTDEWGGGGQPKCREEDPMEWGANALFTINKNNKMEFQSYYKMPAPQSAQENCVAHNGSLIPVPDRDIMVQSWYQGGISIFDWTDPKNPVEIAYHDRGPVDSTRMQMGGSWSVYWYNGNIVNSEIARGLDIFELKPSPYLTKNEIAAANTVKFEQLNAQGQPKFDWPATFALAKAYIDQLEREKGLAIDRISSARQKLADAEQASGAERSRLLNALAEEMESQAGSSDQSEKIHKLAKTMRTLASK